MEIEPGTVVASRYRVLRQLGRGGMGEVFAAENIRTGRTVAVKVLRADSKQKASAVERFRREARAAGAISSDYVTQVLDVEDDTDHGIVIVFELLEGESLIDRLKRMGPMTFDELFPIVEQVWMGLADAHKSGVIHRDLKPSNVFLEKRPDTTIRVKILDFGISKIPKEVGGETLTEMGQSLGTFSFMPPEQIGKAKTVDHRADIYACATLIYQAMSGQLPYAAKNILQMVDLKTKSEPRALSTVLDGQVDPRLEAFLAKGLARDPGQRFQSASEALDVWRGMRRASGTSGTMAAVRTTAPTAQPASGGSTVTAPGGGTMRGNVQQHAMQPSSHQSSGSHQAISQQQHVPQPQGRTPATVMLTDPRSHNVSPLPAQSAYSPPQGNMMGQGAVAQAPVRTQGKLGGTVAMASGGPAPQVAYAGAAAGGKPAINVPVVNDTTSEGGGDQVATIAMPVRNVAQAVGLGQSRVGQSGTQAVPRVHDDSERGQMGTQLMSHASLRQAGANIPTTHRSGSHPRPMPSSPGMQSPYTPGASGAMSALPSAGAGASGPMPISSPDSSAPSGEGADLTTVYRRDKQETTGSTNLGSSQAGTPVPSRRGSRMWIFVGVVLFALVGFAIAAILLRYFQSHTLPWQ